MENTSKKEAVYNEILSQIEGIYMSIQDFKLIRSYLDVIYSLGFDEGRAHPVEHLKKPIILLNDEGKEIRRFESRAEAVKLTGYPSSSIFDALTFKRKYKDYYWKYA
jgi:hypothetical protein